MCELLDSHDTQFVSYDQNRFNLFSQNVNEHVTYASCLILMIHNASNSYPTNNASRKNCFILPIQIQLVFALNLLYTLQRSCFCPWDTNLFVDEWLLYSGVTLLLTIFSSTGCVTVVFVDEWLLYFLRYTYIRWRVTTLFVDTWLLSFCLSWWRKRNFITGLTAVLHILYYWKSSIVKVHHCTQMHSAKAAATDCARVRCRERYTQREAICLNRMMDIQIDTHYSRSLAVTPLYSGARCQGGRHASCRTYWWIMCDMSHTWRSHDTHMDESCYTRGFTDGGDWT